MEKGDRIAFLLVNSPTYVFAFFAAMKLGAVGVNLSVGIQGEELARCLKDSGAKVVVTLDLFAQDVYQVIKETGVKTVILHSVFGLEKRMSVEEGLLSPCSSRNCWPRRRPRKSRRPHVSQATRRCSSIRAALPEPPRPRP